MRRLLPCLSIIIVALAAMVAAAAPQAPQPPAPAAPCADLLAEGVSYTVCSVDARQASIRLFLRDPAGAAEWAVLV